MKPLPITYVWRGGALWPLQRFHNYAARLFGPEGSEHTLEPASMRSLASHNHYFAALHEAWVNLPEEVAAKFFDEDDFRARLLVEAGCLGPPRFVSLPNHEQAARLALFAPMATACVCSVNENVVAIRFVKSQSLSSMGKAEFEASKKAVLDIAASMVGVATGELKKNAGRSA